MRKLILSLLLSLPLIASESINNDALFSLERSSGISLHSALRHVVQHNPKVLASRYKVLQAKRKLDETYAKILPKIDLSGDVGYESRTLAPDNINTIAAQTALFDYSKTDLFISLTQNLYSAGANSEAINEQKHRFSATLFNHRYTMEDTIIKVIEAYFDIIYNEIALNVNQKNMDDINKVLKIMEIKEQNGAATKGDLNFVKANAKNAESELLKTETKLIEAKAKYIYLMGLETLSSLPFELHAKMNVTKIDAVIDSLVHNNAKLQREHYYIQAAQAGYQAQKSAFQPQVDLTLNGEARDEKNIRKDSLGAVGQQAKVTMLLNFKYNLYRGGSDEAKLVRLLDKVRELKFSRNDLQNKLIFDAKVLHRSLSALDSSLTLVQSEVISARKVVDAYWNAFKDGTQDLQALQQALRTKNRAELDYVRFKKKQLVDFFKLQHQSGQLLQHLALDFSYNIDDYQK